MNRADAIGLDEMKRSHIIPADKIFDPLIVGKAEFLYKVYVEGQLPKDCSK